MKEIKNCRYLTFFLGTTLVIISVLIKVSTFFPLWIEKNYSRGMYPHISWFYRKTFGWLPFSIGDLLYATAVVYILYKLINFVKLLTKGPFYARNLLKGLKKVCFIVACIYIYFNLAWGLNYNRPGIAAQLKLNPQLYNVQDLELISNLLLQKVNNSKRIVISKKTAGKSYNEVFAQAQIAYNSVAEPFPFLEYRTKSVKRSLYGKMGNMLGFLGYYNPFTGEAQLNLTMPRFLTPYVTCHEMAHQLGYASESEANFVGYLAATNAKDSFFHYSAYFDLFNYANNQLFLRDSSAAIANYKQLDTLVKKDFQELKEYWKKSDNAIEPFIRTFYDNYLKANQQTKGVNSYNEVIGWLIAYYKKFGHI